MRTTSTNQELTGASGPSRRRSRLVVLIASGALVLAACGGSDGGDASTAVASLGDTPVAADAPADESAAGDPGSGESEDGADGGAPDSAGGSAESTDDGDGAPAGDSDLEAPEDEERAYELYEQCLSDLGLDLGVAEQNGAAVESSADEGATEVASLPELDDDAFEQLQECEGHLANLDSSFDLSPEQQAALADAELAFSRCMREAGIDVPDPTGDSGTMIEFDGDVDIDAFEAAADECNSAFDDLNDMFEAGGDQ